MKIFGFGHKKLNRNAEERPDKLTPEEEADLEGRIPDQETVTVDAATVIALIYCSCCLKFMGRIIVYQMNVSFKILFKKSDFIIYLISSPFFVADYPLGF